MCRTRGEKNKAPDFSERVHGGARSWHSGEPRDFGDDLSSIAGQVAHPLLRFLKRFSPVLSHVSALAPVANHSLLLFACLANIIKFKRLYPGRPDQIPGVLNWTPSPKNNFIQCPNIYSSRQGESWLFPQGVPLPLQVFAFPYTIRLPPQLEDVDIG